MQADGYKALILPHRCLLFSLVLDSLNVYFVSLFLHKIIKEALKMWEKFGFKDMSLWETFQDDFEGFTEEDFRSASIHHQRKLRDYLQKYGVGVRKQ